jgi:hypothetical protein
MQSGISSASPEYKEESILVNRLPEKLKTNDSRPTSRRTLKKKMQGKIISSASYKIT